MESGRPISNEENPPLRLFDGTIFSTDIVPLEAEVLLGLHLFEVYSCHSSLLDPSLGLLLGLHSMAML